jgi:hypothetical protein
MRAPLVLAGTVALAVFDFAAPPAVAQTAPPAVVTLEGAPDGARTEVMLRAPGGASAGRRLGAVVHAEGAARGALVLPGGGATGPTVLVVATTRRTVRAGAYNASLFRVDGRGGEATRLCDDVAELSVPLRTASGLVLVQRGRDGAEPREDPTAPRVFRERTDTLWLDAVDPVTGRLRTVWRGEGQIAFLAAPLGGDAVAVYWVHDGASTLLRLDAARGTARVLVANLPVAREFSYDARADRVVFARATPDPSVYEVAAVDARAGGAVQVLWRGQSESLMPRALGDGSVALSLPGRRGLAVLPAGVGAVAAPTGRTGATGRTAVVTTGPTRVAPWGDGSDAALAESPDGRWLAVRHTTDAAESWALWNRRTGAVVPVASGGAWMEWAGFVQAEAGR